MTRNNIWIAGMAAPVMIGMLLLFAGSSRVKAADQPQRQRRRTSIISFLALRPLPSPSEQRLPGQTRRHSAHDVSTDGVFKSKVMDTDEKFTYTFNKAGTYSYSARFTRR